MLLLQLARKVAKVYDALAWQVRLAKRPAFKAQQKCAGLMSYPFCAKDATMLPFQSSLRFSSKEHCLAGYEKLLVSEEKSPGSLLSSFIAQNWRKNQPNMCYFQDYLLDLFVGSF